MSINEIKSYKRKKYQRAINKYVRNFNKQVAEDWLWNSRFYISQEWAQFHPFEDKSGALFEVGLVMTDRKTGRQERKMFDNYDISWKMWEWANRCITETWDVWSENPNPNTQARLEGRKPLEFI